MRLYLLLIMQLLFVDIFAQQIPEFKELNGVWVSSDKTNPVAEQWVYSPGYIAGKGFIIRDGKKIVHEHLAIIKLGNSYYYCAHPKENSMPVMFRLKKFEKHYWQFENPEHDYPQMISYRISHVEGKVKLTAEISKLDGTQRNSFIMFKKEEEN